MSLHLKLPEVSAEPHGRRESSHSASEIQTVLLLDAGLVFLEMNQLEVMGSSINPNTSSNLCDCNKMVSEPFIPRIAVTPQHMKEILKAMHEDLRHYKTCMLDLIESNSAGNQRKKLEVKGNEAPTIKGNKVPQIKGIKTPYWVGLPELVVDAISRQLPVVSAIFMGAVCESWRRVIIEQVPPTQKRGLSWLMLCGKNDTVKRTSLSILENRVIELELIVPEAFRRCCWGSIQDWLIMVKKFHPQIEIYFLLEPFFKNQTLVAQGVLYKMVLSTSPNEANCVIILLSSGISGYVCWTPGIKVWRQMSLGISMILAMKEDMHAIDFSHLDLSLRFHKAEMLEKPTWDRMRHHFVESCGEVLLVC
ncbi:hypothetical protein IFM89_030847 [Coptis chinensis]|uniref:KIB1-4 beta-propeller domain-containing protein n=1 Tax=Coptis chinensis TaxID=261450 RepID=A0A835GZ40_9MAGN|nr:hypothetical protein IFM89_030847 [Coptis chinensis]